MDDNNTNALTHTAPGLGNRIAKIANLVGGKKNLAKTIGISESQLYRYISGDSQPTVEPLAAIARYGSVHLDWLILGKGPTGIMPEVNETTANYNQQANFVQIEEYKDEHIDQANLPTSDIGSFAFNYQWLIKKGLNIANLRLLRAHGDAMIPTIDHGDLIVIDINHKQFNGDAIYLLCLDTRLLVAKRLQHKADNGLVILNDNPAYRDQHIAYEQKDSLDIRGKVVWAGGFV